MNVMAIGGLAWLVVAPPLGVLVGRVLRGPRRLPLPNDAFELAA